MILLDTNVLSELMRQSPEQRVVTWLDRQPRSSIWLTSITDFEIRYGLEILPAGRRRSRLLQSYDALLDLIERRIAPFDSTAAEVASQLSAQRHRMGRPVDLRDTMIAGIVISRRATFATRNVIHFDDLPAPPINPWEE